MAPRTSSRARLAALLLVALACSAATVMAQVARPGGPAAADAATLSVQFDNRQRTVLNSRKAKAVTDALATHVFNVPPNQVTVVGGVDQSGILRSQSVVIFKAVGPTTNRRPVLANCQANTRGFLLLRSNAQKAVKRATDSWWPGDAVRIQKANCAPAPRK